jgi:hypothetical protein
MYRLNLIMREYLDNQKTLIETHRQYLELNKRYQYNISAYINSILCSNENISSFSSDLSNIINDTSVPVPVPVPEARSHEPVPEARSHEPVPEARSPAPVPEARSPAPVPEARSHAPVNGATDYIHVPQTRTSNTRRLLSESRRQLSESRNVLDNVRQSRQTRERTRERSRERSTGLRQRARDSRVLNNTANDNTTDILRHFLTPLTEENYSNMSVPRTIVNQECDIVPFNTLDNSQDLCPIDRVPFEANENVMRIRFCGHIFRENNLRENFRNRATCPVCRHNIITTITTRQHIGRSGSRSDSVDNNTDYTADLQWFVRS